MGIKQSLVVTPQVHSQPIEDEDEDEKKLKEEQEEQNQSFLPSHPHPYKNNEDFPYFS
jgi:hypothetical protein